MTNVSKELIAEFDKAAGRDLQVKFHSSKPFPHVVIDNFLSEAGEAALLEFPAENWPYWVGFNDEYQRGKRVCPDLAVTPGPFAELIQECSQPRFLEFLEELTGIEKLIPDPHLDGGGLHCSGEGGVLSPHTDFHFYKRLNLYRVLNLLIYFNEGWTAEDGGDLGLYTKGSSEPHKRIVPTFGRAVIFKTDDQSVHGFASPVAPGKWRKSVALYYYVAREVGHFSGDTATHWQDHGVRLKGLRLALFEALIFASRAFSKAAHTINPNKRIAD